MRNRFLTCLIRRIVFGGLLCFCLRGLEAQRAPEANIEPYHPEGLAVSAAGSIYIADATRNVLCRLSNTGKATVIAGKPDCPGSADGRGSSVRFYFPTALTVGGAGNIFVSDSGNNTIRRIAPGTVTTLAGLPGKPGSADGCKTAAQFHGPRGLAADASGNIYVADRGNHVIRVISPAGMVRTLAGLAGSRGCADGAGSTARFDSPCSVALDKKGNVYVADRGNSVIRVITPAGVVTTLAGEADCMGEEDGDGSPAHFHFPNSIAIDSTGCAFVADTCNATIRKITPAGEVTTFAGLAGSTGHVDGAGGDARFDCPGGVAVDHQGNVYVADTFKNAIRVVTKDGVVTTLTAELADN